MKLQHEILSDSESDVGSGRELGLNISHVINNSTPQDTRKILTQKDIPLLNYKTALSDARVIKNILLSLKRRKYKLEYTEKLLEVAIFVKKSLKADKNITEDLQLNLATLQINLFAFARAIQKSDPKTALSVISALLESKKPRVLDRARTVKKILHKIIKQNDQLNQSINKADDVMILWQHICRIKSDLKQGKEIVLSEKKLNYYRSNIAEARSALSNYIKLYEKRYDAKDVIKWQGKIIEIYDNASWITPSSITVIKRYYDQRNMQLVQDKIDAIALEVKKSIDQLITDQVNIDELEENAKWLRNNALNFDKKALALKKSTRCSSVMLGFCGGTLALAAVGSIIPAVLIPTLGMNSSLIFGGVGIALVIGVCIAIRYYSKNNDIAKNLKIYQKAASEVTNFIRK